jgi:hypothetical protein
MQHLFRPAKSSYGCYPPEEVSDLFFMEGGQGARLTRLSQPEKCLAPTCYPDLGSSYFKQ